MGQMMANMTEGYIETQILSEANCVRYRLNVIASHLAAVPNAVALTINTISQNAPRSRGVNIYEILGNTVGNTKQYDLTNEESTMNNAFLTTVRGYNSGIFIICTHDIFRTSPTVDSWFTSVGSTSRENNQYAVQFPNSAYVCVYDANKKLIMQESFYGNDGVLKEDSRAKLDFVYDAPVDVGSTGIPIRIYSDYDTTLRMGTATMTYPVSGTPALLSDYNIKAGDYVLCIADIVQAQDFLNTGARVVQEIRWLNGNTWVKSDSIEAPNTTIQSRLEQLIPVPSGVDRVSVTYKRSTGTTGNWNIRNSVMSFASSPTRDSAVPSEISVNGIRVNTMNEGKTSYILDLPDNKTHTPNNEINVKEFRETLV